MTDRPIAVVLLSGGLDSMVCAASAREAGYEVAALTIDYGQRHAIEIGRARDLVERLGIARHIVLPLDLTAFGGSALTADVAVPKAGVEAGIPVTYVPARNALFLTLALGWAEVLGARAISIGVNALDYSGYPDCRPEFIRAWEAMAATATRIGVEGRSPTVLTPLQHLTKAQIVAEARRLGLDPDWSWSCYDPTSAGQPCGLCDSCRLRAKGIEEADAA